MIDKTASSPPIKRPMIPAAVLTLAILQCGNLALANTITYDFETGFIPSSSLGAGTTAEGFVLGYIPGSANTGQALSRVSSTTQGLIGGIGAPFGSPVGPPSNFLLATTPSGVDNGAFFLDFSSSLVGDVTGVSIKAGSRNAQTVTQMIATISGIGGGPPSVNVNIPLNSFAGPGFAKYNTAVFNATDYGFTKITQISMSFANSSSALVAASYLFDDIGVTYGGVTPPANNAVLQLGAQSFDLPAFGTQPILNVLKDAANPIHSTSILVQRASGTDAANFSLSNGNSGSPNFEFTTPANPQTGTVAVGQSSVPITIQYHQDVAGHFSNTFTLQNSSNTSDLNDSLTYNLHVYDAPDMHPNNSLAINTSAGPQTLTITNPTGTSPNRAAARLQTVTVTGPFALDNAGIANFSILIPTDTLTGHVSYTGTDTLNGTYTGLIQVSYAPFGMSPLITDPLLGSGNFTWSLTHTITGNTGPGVAHLPAGSPYAGLNSGSNLAHNTTAELLGGAAPAGGTTVAIDFTTASSTGFALSGNVGDAVTLTGTSGSTFVLQLKFSAADLAAAAIPANAEIDIQWFDTTDHTWKNAVLGNSNHPLFLQPALQHAYNPLLDFALGNYGYFYDGLGGGGAWAVLDHNSVFSLAQPVPEPGSLCLLSAGAFLLMRRRKN